LIDLLFPHGQGLPSDPYLAFILDEHSDRPGDDLILAASCQIFVEVDRLIKIIVRFFSPLLLHVLQVEWEEKWWQASELVWIKELGPVETSYRSDEADWHKFVRKLTDFGGEFSPSSSILHAFAYGAGGMGREVVASQ
jgi:hypothetical protein